MVERALGWGDGSVVRDVRGTGDGGVDMREEEPWGLGNTVASRALCFRH